MNHVAEADRPGLTARRRFACVTRHNMHIIIFKGEDPMSFRVMIVRGNDATEQKRYDFEARSTNEAVEIVDEIAEADRPGLTARRRFARVTRHDMHIIIFKGEDPMVGLTRAKRRLAVRPGRSASAM
jgi:hypothetical protein